MKTQKYLRPAAGIALIAAIMFLTAVCAPKKSDEPVAPEQKVTVVQTESREAQTSPQIAEPPAAEDDLIAEAADPEYSTEGSPLDDSQNTSVSQTQGAAAPRYAIGDTGPNGGIIFSNTGGKYKEITAPGKETAMRPGVERYLRAEAEYHRLSNENMPTAEETSRLNNLRLTLQRGMRSNATEEQKKEAAGAEVEIPQLEALISEKRRRAAELMTPQLAIVAAAAIAALPPAPPSGWRLTTAPELIEIYNALVKTGKTSFGNKLYWSSSVFTVLPRNRTSGTDYRRQAVAFTPFETPFMFPGYEIILAGGGENTDFYHVMDMSNGAIIHAEFDIFEERLTCNFRDGSYRNFKFEDILIPYVREF